MRTAQTGRRSSPSSDRICEAAITLFRKRGYHGTPMRSIASAIGLEAGSLYYHFASKQEILFAIIDGTMNDLLEGLQTATEGPGNPGQRLHAAVRFHVLFHAYRRDEAFISRSELRSLTQANLRRSLGKRDHYEELLCRVLAAGMSTGDFDVPDARLATMAILTMCSAVADWFSERGPLTAEGVAASYAAMVLRTVRAPGRGSRRAGTSRIASVQRRRQGGGARRHVGAASVGSLTGGSWSARS